MNGPGSRNNRLITSEDLSLSALKAQQVNQPLDNEWGIDTVSVAIKATETKLDWGQSGWHSTTTDGDDPKLKAKHFSNFKVGWANVRVTYLPVYGSIYVEFNASKVRKPASTYLLEPDQLSDVVQQVLLAVVNQIPVLPNVLTIDRNGAIELNSFWEESVLITRLDCARNFKIDRQSYLRQALTSAGSKYQKTAHIYWDRKGWTRMNTTKREGVDRIYDKSAELQKHNLDTEFEWSSGVYRFEAQLRRDRLKRFGLDKLSGVTNSSVWQGIHGRWMSTNWDILIPGEGSIIDLLSDVQPDKRLRFVGYLSLASLGLEDAIIGPEARDMLKLAKKYGVTPGVNVDKLGKMNLYLSLRDGRPVSFHSDE